MTSALSFVEQDFPPQDLGQGSIVDVFMRNASWVWTPEPGLEPPMAPPNEQRVFRKTFSASTSALHGKTPVSATIIAAVDNDFALYINGVLFQSTDPHAIQTSWERPRALSVPIPTGIDKLVFAIRAINLAPDNNAAGIKAAILRITNSDGSSDFLFTGQDQSWLGKSLYPEGWEKPEFDDGAWEPALVLSQRFNTLHWGNLREPMRISVASVLPSATSGLLPNQITSTALPPVEQVEGVVISAGALAGVMIGTVVAAAGLAVVMTYIFMRRKLRLSNNVVRF